VSNRKRLYIAGAIAAIVALAAVGGGIAVAGGGDDNEQPIAGNALDQASKAALAHTGGGVVTETEVGDEEGYYEVEVTLDGGSQVDVHLDENFRVLNSVADGEESGEQEGPGDD